MCYMLDLATSIWKTMRTPYTARRLPQMVYSDLYDRLYYYGGTTPQQQWVKTVEKYSFDVGEIIGWQGVRIHPNLLRFAQL